MNNMEEAYYLSDEFEKQKRILNLSEVIGKNSEFPEEDNKTKMVDTAIPTIRAAAELEIPGTNNILKKYITKGLAKLNNQAVLKLDEYDAEISYEQEELAQTIDKEKEGLAELLENEEDVASRDIMESNSSIALYKQKYNTVEREHLKNIFLRNNIEKYQINEKKIGIFTKFSLKRNSTKQADKLYDGIQSAFSDIEKGLNGITYKPYKNVTEEIGYNAALLVFYTEKLEGGKKLTELQKRDITDQIVSNIMSKGFSPEKYSEKLKDLFPKDELTNYIENVEFNNNEDALFKEENIGFFYTIDLYNEWLNENTTVETKEPFSIDNIISGKNAEKYFDMMLMVMFLNDKDISDPIDFNTSVDLINELKKSIKTSGNDGFVKKYVDSYLPVSHLQLINNIHVKYVNLKNNNLKELTKSQDYLSFCKSIKTENNIEHINLLTTATQFCDSGVVDIWQERAERLGAEVSFGSIIACMIENHINVLENYNFMEQSAEMIETVVNDTEAIEQSAETLETVVSDTETLEQSLAEQVEQILNEQKDQEVSTNLGEIFDEQSKVTDTAGAVEEEKLDTPVNDNLTNEDVVSTMQPSEYEVAQEEPVDNKLSSEKLNSIQQEKNNSQTNEKYSQKILNQKVIIDEVIATIVDEASKESDAKNLAEKNKLNIKIKKLESDKFELLKDYRLLDTKYKNQDQRFNSEKEKINFDHKTEIRTLNETNAKVIDEKDAEILNLEKENKEKNDLLKAASTANINLTAKIFKLETENKEKNNLVEAASNANINLTKENKSLKDKNKTLEEQMDELKEQLNSIQKENELLRTNVTQLRTFFDNMTLPNQQPQANTQESTTGKGK